MFLSQPTRVCPFALPLPLSLMYSIEPPTALSKRIYTRSIEETNALMDRGISITAGIVFCNRDHDTRKVVQQQSMHPLCVEFSQTVRREKEDHAGPLL